MQVVEENHLQALERICKSTHGNLFMVKHGGEIVEILSKISPTGEMTHYVPATDGEISIPIQAKQTLSLVINCLHHIQEKHQIPGSSINIEAKPVLSTDYITILDIISNGNEAEKMRMRLSTSLIEQCDVSTWSERKLVHMYPVQQDIRRQLYPESTRGNVSL